MTGRIAKHAKMDGSSSHLDAEAAAMLDRSPEERIAFTRAETYIAHPMAEHILDKLDALLESPRSTRMPNLLIVGESSSGKSTILRTFRDAHPPSDNGNGQPTVPVVLVETPSEPSEIRFFRAILEGFGIEYSSRATPDAVRKQARAALTELGTKIIAFDEIHSVLSGSAREQHKFLINMKSLSNTLRVSLVAAGTEAAAQVMRVDNQMSLRFDLAPITLWPPNSTFRGLLDAFERTLPLPQPSNLSSVALMPRLHALSRGVIGELRNVLVEATVLAIKRDKPYLDEALIEEARPIRVEDIGRYNLSTAPLV